MMNRPSSTRPEAQIETDTDERQRVWPLFVLALGLAAFGFYFALAETADTAVKSKPLRAEFLSVAKPPAVEAAVEAPIELRYERAERSYRVDVQQRLVRDGKVTRARLAVGIDEVPEGDGAGVNVRYSDVSVQLDDGEEPVGSDVAREVERLLEVTSHRVERAPTGEIEVFELTSSESAQLRQTIALLRDAIDIAHPRLPREAVLGGEEWSWTLEAAGDTPLEAGGELESSAVFRAKVEGRTSDGDLLISLAAVISGRGSFPSEGARAREFEIAGTGDGWALYRSKSGRLVTSDVTHRVKYSYAGGTISSEIHVHLANE